MNYTYQERKNHKNFFISLGLEFLSLAGFIICVQEQWTLFGSLFLGALMFNFLWIFYIGYSHGWELKRISIIQEEEEEQAEWGCSGNLTEED